MRRINEQREGEGRLDKNGKGRMEGGEEEGDHVSDWIAVCHQAASTLDIETSAIKQHGNLSCRNDIVMMRSVFFLIFDCLLLDSQFFVFLTCLLEELFYRQHR